MWVWYSLFFAIWNSVATLLIKSLIKKISPLPLLYATSIFGIPFTFILLFFVGGIPEVTLNFYLYEGASAILDTIAFILSFLAISKSQLSVIFPLSSFAPVFTTLIAAVTLNEIPTSTNKIIGILLVVFGAYLLNAADIRQGVMMPIKRLFSNTGVKLSLISYFIWSITPIFQKKAIFETQPQIPLFASFFGGLLVFLFLTPFAFKKALKYKKDIKLNIKWFVILGIGGAFAQAAAFAAFSLAYLGYATAVFRLSTLFIIIFGGVFLKEERIKERLFGASVMLLGTILLAL